MTAISLAAASGIIIKDASVLDSLPRVNCVGLDKTGTLTQGRCRVVFSIHIGPMCKEQVHEIMTAMEKYSSHPLAPAIINFAVGCVADENDSTQVSQSVKYNYEASDVNVVEGGISGCVDSYKVRIGNAILNSNSTNYDSLLA